MNKYALINIESLSIDTSGLSEPGKALVNRSFDALGAVAKGVAGLFKLADHSPAHVIDISGLPDSTQRAVVRLFGEADMQQKNIEAILLSATQQVNDDARPENIEQDWLRDFFDKCRNVSDEQMQILWARILAGEANQPSTFSKRTLQTLTTLSTEEAEAFIKICEFAVTFEHPQLFMEGGSFFSSGGPSVPMFNKKILNCWRRPGWCRRVQQLVIEFVVSNWVIPVLWSMVIENSPCH